jgi:hypothetical protein
VIQGDATVNRERMATGDAAEIWGEPLIDIEADSSVAAEIILVDVQL